MPIFAPEPSISCVHSRAHKKTDEIIIGQKRGGMRRFFGSFSLAPVFFGGGGSFAQGDENKTHYLDRKLNTHQF